MRDIYLYEQKVTANPVTIIEDDGFGRPASDEELARMLCLNPRLVKSTAPSTLRRLFPEGDEPSPEEPRPFAKAVTCVSRDVATKLAAKYCAKVDGLRWRGSVAELRRATYLHRLCLRAHRTFMWGPRQEVAS